MRLFTFFLFHAFGSDHAKSALSRMEAESDGVPWPLGPLSAFVKQLLHPYRSHMSRRWSLPPSNEGDLQVQLVQENCIMSYFHGVLEEPAILQGPLKIHNIEHQPPARRLSHAPKARIYFRIFKLEPKHRIMSALLQFWCTSQTAGCLNASFFPKYTVLLQSWVSH